MADAKLEEIREAEGVWPGWVLIVGGGTAAFLAASMAGLWLLYNASVKPTEQSVSRFPAPELQSDPAGDLRDFQKQQAQQLQGYAWVDRRQGTIRVPIDQAMRVVAGRGVGAFDPPPGTPPFSGPAAEAAKASDAASAAR